METFTELKSFIDNHDFQYQRNHSLKMLDFGFIDKPIVGLIRRISELDFCFSLQSCYGHFLFQNQNDPHNLSSLSVSYIPGEIEYRIGYIALCIDNSDHGKNFLDKLKVLQSIDERYIQIGCADWFWDQQVNSYVLQVEPERFKYEDKINVTYEEALHLEKIRNSFFIKLIDIICKLS
jgi:hypothetical protein